MVASTLKRRQRYFAKIELKDCANLFKMCMPHMLDKSTSLILSPARPVKTSSAISLCAFLTLGPAISHAAVLYNESVSGDISSTQSTPTSLTLQAGSNSIIGTVGSGDSQDWLTFAVPSGFTLNSLVLAAYSSNDAQGFTGMQAGSVFVGSSNTAANYLGYAHFGTTATNGSLPSANLVGQDLLPIMSTQAGSPGSQHFTTPLPSGSYAFLIQQLGATTSYQFNYSVVAVPEASSAGLSVLLGGMALLSRRRMKR